MTSGVEETNILYFRFGIILSLKKFYLNIVIAVEPNQLLKWIHNHFFIFCSNLIDFILTEIEDCYVIPVELSH